MTVGRAAADCRFFVVTDSVSGAKKAQTGRVTEQSNATGPLRIILLGDSLNLDQAIVHLPATLRLEWLRLPSHPQRQQLLAAKAHLVLFDARHCDLDAVLAFIDAHPAALVVGINPVDQTATVLSGETYPLTSKQDLANLIALVHDTMRDGPLVAGVSSNDDPLFR